MTREQKALEIAKLEGWEPISYTEITEDYYKDCFKNVDSDLALTTQDLEYKYSSFNGLMEIVERVNKSQHNYQFSINYYYSSHYKKIQEQWVRVECTNYEEAINYRDFGYDNAPLIDALQDAILYYLKEVKK